jgi:predicted DCC family thiol-disulfide oxidoreductase YuxK/thiol-disulfide isomerase/thioredoxin
MPFYARAILQRATRSLVNNASSSKQNIIGRLRGNNVNVMISRRKQNQRKTTAQRTRRSITKSAAVQDAEATKAQPEPSNWEYKYLYDGACPVCRSLKAALEGTGKGKGKIYYVNIADPLYDASKHQGVTFEDAMESLHVLKRDGSEPLLGLPAIETLFGAVGFGWAVKLATLPPVGFVASLMYKLISSNRLKLGGDSAFGAGIMALGRVGLELRGEKASCSEGDECRGIADMEVEEGQRGVEVSKPNEPQMKIAKKKKEGGVVVEGGSVTLPAASVDFSDVFSSGPEFFLGAYASGGYITAAIVSVRSGELDSELIEEEVTDVLDINNVGVALKSLCKRLKWQGGVAVALPGVWHAEQQDNTTIQQYDSMESLSPMESRAEREETEESFRNLVGLDVAVITGAEAHGYGHADLWGDVNDINDSQNEKANEMDGLVGVVTAGQEAMHVALFKDGTLLSNADFRSADLASTWNNEEWSQSPPPSKECEDEEQWKKWATRVAVHLARVEACRCARTGLKRWVVAGSAGENFNKWSHLVPQLSVTLAQKQAASLVKGGSNRTEGVRGAAAGGGFRFRYAADVLRVRAAIGKKLGKSPQLVDAEQLRTLFDQFADPNSPETVDTEAFVRMVSALGIRLPPDEIRELIIDVDMDDSNKISFEEFEGWYRQVVGTGAVTVLHTEQAVDQVLNEEKGTGRAVVLKVGFTSCAPCKKFLPHFEQRALDFRESARFVRIYGNENASTIHLARDRLSVKTTPTFFVFKDGELTHSHSGANVDKFDDAIKEQIGEFEQGTYKMNWEKPAVADEAVPSI